ncbi:hypothetical protein K474DRAFT_1574632, partial [Panus rudis PR-1116 ss-1]
SLFPKSKITQVTESADIVLDPCLVAHFQDGDKLRELAVNMVDTPEPGRAHRVLVLAHKLGYAPKVNAYECVAHRLAVRRHWGLIPSIVALCRQHVGRVTVRLLNWRTKAACELSNFHLLEFTLRAFQLNGLQPNQRTYHHLISGHLRNRNLEKAKEYLTLMVKAGFPIDATTHSIIVSSYRSLGPDRSVQSQSLASLPQMGVAAGTMVLNSLIQMSLDMRDLDGAVKHLTTFGRPYGEVASKAEHGDASIRHVGRNSTVVGDTPLTSPDLRLSPDATTFTILLNYMAKEQDIPSALETIQRMVATDIKPDSHLVAALIHTYFAAAKPNLAVRIAWRSFRSLPATSPLFRQLLKDSESDDETLPPIDTKPSLQILNTLLAGVQERYGLDSALLVHKIMFKAGMVPDDHTVEIVMSYLSRFTHIRPRELIRFLRNLPASIKPTLRHVHIILARIFRSWMSFVPRGWHAGFKHIPPVSSPPITAGPFDLSAPLAGLWIPQYSSYRSLIPVVRYLARRRIRGDRATFALRMRYDAVLQANANAADQSMHAMVSAGVHPNHYHFAALMEGLARSGNLPAAESIFNKAVEDGLIPSVVLYTILISGYARRKAAKPASRIFRNMVEQGVRPDAAAIDALASAYYRAGAYAIARTVYTDFWQYVGPFPETLRTAPLKVLARALRNMGQSKRPPRLRRLDRN